MCDVSGDGGGCGTDAEPPRRRRAPGDSHPRTCVKCGQGTAALIIRVGDPFCRGCFREYFVHKFRAMLGKNRIIFPGEKVLLALSGGSASSAMVRQVQEGLSREAAKRLRFVPGLVYVEEGAVRRQSPEQRKQTLAHMETLLQATGFPYHLIHLEEALELPPSILQPGPEQSSKSGPSGPSYKEAVDSFIQQKRQEGDSATSLPGHSTQDMPVGPPYTPRLPDTAQTQELLRIFEAVETSTAREELLQMLRTHLILQMARSRGYSKVMTGETCTRVAIKLLTNLSLGRGAFLAVDTGFTDKRHGDVMVVRPMRDYTAKEIAFYNHFFNIPTVIVPPLFTKRREKPSIHHLIERFLLGLQEDFPSTISTVYRTGEKLSPDPAKASSESQRCLLCLCGLDIEGGLRAKLPIFHYCATVAASPSRSWALSPHCHRTYVLRPSAGSTVCPSLAVRRWSGRNRTRSAARAEGVGDSGGHRPPSLSGTTGAGASPTRAWWGPLAPISAPAKGRESPHPPIYWGPGVLVTPG
ncbi:cytoplasmic tRNA 2-thiolation protein 2 isoform X1 [Neopelma chrysocephalum]|uniref:cytoplasmic tRNA 2-thiolation protein 2 isoform X1 n=2 Tax=Neopelma chrysocephalum TaxID=114329 RepID=UPI000FCD1E81|nr:cytoplasmic tRNA 2-thiolation protein 2 isoform X1 [Neopelma chrysocephalum]